MPRRTAIPPPLAVTSYWERSRWPLQALYFLLPLILLYEIGVLLYAEHYDVTARLLMRAGLEIFGVTGYYLPGLLVIVLLTAMHIARRDPWQPEPKLWPGMWIESILLALPLFVLTVVMFRQPLASVTAAVSLPLLGSSTIDQLPSWQSGIVFSIGAGIYEELLFRVIAIALIHLVVVDLCKLPATWGAILAVTGSAVAFALYHFMGEHNPFDWPLFTFYTLAGIYLAGVYLVRGFGIVAATHALYDVFVITAAFRHAG